MLKEDEENTRRSFLKASIITGVAALTAGVIGCNSDTKTKSSLTGKKVPLLDSAGNLIYVDEGQIPVHTNFKGITNEESRKGIAGKKFVMVIDLAKCDGCGKCTEACNKMHYLPKEKEWIQVLEMQDAPKVVLEKFSNRTYPPKTEVRIVSAYENTPMITALEPMGVSQEYYSATDKYAFKAADKITKNTAAILRKKNPGLTIPLL